MTRVREALSLLAVAVIAGCGGFAFHGVFGVGPLEPVISVAAAVPVLLAAVWSSRQRRIPLGLAMLLSAACWLLIVTATVLRSTATAGFLPSGHSLSAVGHGLIDSWWQILTTVLPVSRDPELLVGVHALIWFASAAGAEAVLRTRATLLAAGPPALVMVVGLVLNAGTSGSSLVPTAIAVFAGGALILLRQDGLPVRVFASGAALVTGVAVVAAAMGPRLPFVHDRVPFDPRSHVVPAAASRPAASPLDEISEWLAEPQATLFTATLPAGQAPSSWRLAVLDSFDGVDWTQSGRLQSTGGRVPADAAQSAPQLAASSTGTLHQDVEVDALGGEWLPTIGRASQVSGITVDVDVDSGVLLTHDPLRTGERYQVDSQPTSATFDAPRQARLAVDPAALALPPGMPAVIAQTAQTATAGSLFPAQQAVRLADYLRANEVYDPQAPPGHAYGHIAYFLSTSHKGTPEQFATAYALMARSIGLPSRVVVGFAAGNQDSDGRWRVRGADVLAWPEVEFAGIGWMPFFPTPAVGAANGLRSLAAGEPQQRAELDQQIAVAAPAAASSGTASGPHKPVAGSQSSTTGLSVWAALLLVLGAVSAGYGASVVLVPFRRRAKRRGAADPGTRAVGAWLQTLEQLRGLGLAPTAAGTVPETARRASAHLLHESGLDVEACLRPLAGLADHAAFAAEPLTADAGRQAWDYQDTFSQAVRGAVPLRRRALRRLHPRTLRG